MSDHTALWLLFALLSVLFVLVVVTARRGPWTRPPVERPLILRATHEQIESIRFIPYDVDPLWGRNRPE